MREVIVGLGCMAALAGAASVQGCCATCAQGQSCQPTPVPAGGNSPIHWWAGTNNLKLNTKVCKKSTDCAVGAPAGAGANESFCTCALTDRYDPGGGAYQCTVGGTAMGAAAGRCAWQVKESASTSVCVANTPYVCSNGSTVVTCNATGTGWTSACP